MFKFNLNDKIAIAVAGSNEEGTVVGRGEFNYSDNSYLIRYVNGNGNTIENWWTESALVAV